MMIDPMKVNILTPVWMTLILKATDVWERKQFFKTWYDSVCVCGLTKNYPLKFLSL